MVAMNVWPTDAADGSVATEARWRKMARQWLASGVLDNVGGEMKPTLAYPNLTVKNGACWVDGHFCELLGDQVLAVTANGLAVVRFDPAANTAELLYRDGVTTPAQNPTGTWELSIAQITGSTLIDKRTIISPTTGPQLVGQVRKAVGVSAPSGAMNLMPWDTITYNPANLWDSAASGWRIPAGQGGIWRVDAGISFPANVAGTLRYINVRVNGAATVHEAAAPAPTTGEAFTVTVSADILLAANDVVTLIAYQSSGVALNITGYFSIRKVAETP